MTEHLLDGCRAKLRRAYVHLWEIAGLVGRFESDHPYEAMILVGPNGRAEVQLTADVVVPPAEEWGVVLGDYAHNLASALDQLVCVLFNLNPSNLGKDCERTHFPIHKNIESWRAVNAGRRIVGLADPHQAIIQAVQPYTGVDGYPPEQNPLWQLFTLNNIDKHRRVPLLHTAVRSEFVSAVGHPLPGLRVFDGSKRGDIIAAFDASGAEGRLRVGRIGHVVFGPGSGDLTGHEFVQVLDGLPNHICNRVFPKFNDFVGDLAYPWPPSYIPGPDGPIPVETVIVQPK